MQANAAQANPAQANPVQAVGAPARHAAPAGGRPGGGPAFSRPPMPPLTPAAGQADPEDLQNADPGWGAEPWQRQRPGPTGSAGPSRPGGE
jgi:hypothetical protein